MASRVGMTRAHFTRIYRQHRGHTPGTFLRETRVNAIAQALRSGMETDLIATKFGFSHARHLSQFIRRNCGMEFATWQKLHTGK